MIVVIADDLTGGAEIAGIGLRYGMSVELATSVATQLPDVELWVVALNTRSMNVQDAVNTITHSVLTLKMLGVEEIFKKTDSVLRGHIVKELAAQLQVQGKKKVILCPANPAAGRKIVNGVYLINNVPISETDFANDPDYPVKSSFVNEILQVELLKTNKIKVSDANTEDDLIKVVKKKDTETILAGSAAFFNTYVKSLNYIPSLSQKSAPVFSNALIVYGSAFNRNGQIESNAKHSGIDIIYFSPQWINESDLEKYLEDCVIKLIKSIMIERKVILAIGKPILRGKESAGKIKDAISNIVVRVMSKVTINELFIEGGATSFAIIKALNFTRFTPTDEFGKGVVRMKIKENNDLFLTIKPGSYEFPKEIWNFKINE